MSEKDRIEQAMARMGEFTVADLASVCDASPSTVRTVLARSDGAVEPLGRQLSNGPGGRWKRYRLTAAARKELMPRAESSAEPGVSPELIAVEEMLSSVAAAEAGEAMRASLLERARRRIQFAAADAVVGPETVAHEHAVDGLIALVEAEAGGEADGLRRAEHEFGLARELLPPDDPLLPTLDERLARSPLNQPLASVERDVSAVSRALALKSVVGIAERIAAGTQVQQRSRRIAASSITAAASVTGLEVKITVGQRPTGRRIAVGARMRKTPTIRKVMADGMVIGDKVVSEERETPFVHAPVAKFGDPNQRAVRHG